MPTYDYRCQACGHQFEEIHSIAERKKPETQRCPNCGAQQIKLAITGMPPILDPHRMGRIKPSQGWQDFANKLKKDNPGSDFTTW